MRVIVTPTLGLRTFGAERRRGGFVDSVERANIYAEHAQKSDAFGAATLYTGRCELAPTTPVRPRAHVKYSKRFHAAYGHHRTRIGVPCRSSRTMSLAPRSDRPRNIEFLLPITVLGRPRRSHRRALPWFSIDIPPNPNCSGPHHEHRQKLQSAFRPFVGSAKLCAVTDRSVDITYAMTLLFQHSSSHRCSRMRFGRNRPPSVLRRNSRFYAPEFRGNTHRNGRKKFGH